MNYEMPIKHKRRKKKKMAEQKLEGTIIKDLTSNPAPLGLLGFGMTTVLLNIHNAGFYEVTSMVMAMGIFYGGLAQIIAGIMEWKKGNTFGTTAFTSYGLFWLTLVFIFIKPMGTPAATAIEMGCYLTMWGIFTAFMFAGTFKSNKATMFIFGSLTLLFFLLAAGKFTGDINITHIAGYEGIICGASAIYAAMAQVLNEVYKKTVLPL